MRIESKLQLETYMVERPRSEIAPEAASYPFIYSADDRIDLGRIDVQRTRIKIVGHPGGSRLFVLGAVASEVAALHQAVDIALSLNEAVLGPELCHELGELVPPRLGFLP
jgi:hypothetical protein